MRSLRARLILSHVLPLLVVIPLVGVALAYLLETQVLLGLLPAALAEADAPLGLGLGAGIASTISKRRRRRSAA